MYMFLFALDMYVYLHLFFAFIYPYILYVYIYFLKYLYIYIVHLLSIHVGCKVQYFTESAQVLKEFPNWNHFFGSYAFLRTKALSLGGRIIGRRGLVFLPGRTCDGCDAYNAMRDTRKSGIWTDLTKVIEVWTCHKSLCSYERLR